MSLREEILKVLARPPYRFESKRILDLVSLEALAGVPNGERWRSVDDELAAMVREGIVHPQNRAFVRADRLHRDPPPRNRAPVAPHPKQTGFGFGERDQ